MPIDKSWINEPNLLSDKYSDGVTAFIEFARDSITTEGKIRCLCTDCLNCHFRSIRIVECHLLDRGFQRTYRTWIFHGESYADQVSAPVSEDSESEDDVDEMFEVLEDINQSYVHGEEDNKTRSACEVPQQEGFETYTDLFSDVERELYPNCRSFSALTFLVKLMHLKVLNKWSNKSFDILLKLLNKAFPEGTKLPKSHYEAKSTLRSLGLGYESIDACKYDCALFWKENASLEICPICNESRWVDKDTKGKKVPHKVLQTSKLV